MQRIFKTNGSAGNYQQLSFTINNQPLQQPGYSWIKSLYTNNSKIYFSVDQYNNHGEELFVSDSINTLDVGNDNIVRNKILIYLIVSRKKRIYYFIEGIDDFIESFFLFEHSFRKYSF